MGSCLTPSLRLLDTRYSSVTRKLVRSLILRFQVDFPCVITVEGEDKKICSYVADFRYKRDGEVVVEDTKGIITQVFTLKKKLVEALYPGLKILIVKDPREWA